MVKKSLIGLSLLGNVVFIAFLIFYITRPSKIYNVDISGGADMNLILTKPLQVPLEDVSKIGKSFWDKEWKTIKWRRLVELDSEPKITDISSSLVHVVWPIRIDNLNQEQFEKFSQIRCNLERKLISLGDKQTPVQPNELDVIENILQKAKQ